MKQSEGRKPRFPIFKERFRELQGDMSDTDFAEKLGLSRQTVGFYGNGDRVPDAFLLRQIAEECKVSADWLLGLSSVQERNSNLQDICSYTGLSANAVKNIAIRKNLHPYIETCSFLIEDNTLLKLLVNYCASFTLKGLDKAPYNYIPLKHERYRYTADIQFAAIIRYLPELKKAFEDCYSNDDSFLKISIFNYLLNNADIKECKHITHEEYPDFKLDSEWFESFCQSSDYKDFMDQIPSIEDDNSDLITFMEEQRMMESAVEEFLDYYKSCQRKISHLQGEEC